MRINTIEKKVEFVLKTYPKSRDSDKNLIVYYMIVYHGVTRLTEILDDDIPSFESITRCRRHLQSLGLYKASEQVEMARYELESEYGKVFA